MLFILLIIWIHIFLYCFPSHYSVIDKSAGQTQKSCITDAEQYSGVVATVCIFVILNLLPKTGSVIDRIYQPSHKFCQKDLWWYIVPWVVNLVEDTSSVLNSISGLAILVHG
jgi:hypothetical protein